MTTTTPAPRPGLPLLFLLTTLLVACGGTGGGGERSRNPAQDMSIRTRDAHGQPIDVGLLVLGHSTSIGGDWPEKLKASLAAAGDDPRNYVVFNLATSGDGGFLWTMIRAQPGETAHARFLASSTAQWCEDDAEVRWSCRRTRLERGLTGREPASAQCLGTRTGCSVRPLATCTWHDAQGRHSEQNVPFHICWQRMDVRLALIQDTSNRSWPVDDYDADGDLDDQDFWPVSVVGPQAAACPDSSGVINDQVDWNCDGLLDAQDAPRRVYAGWLQDLAGDLLDGFGDASADAVYLMHKPVELSDCRRSFADDARCAPHATRAATPSAPFDRYYLPSVYWERDALALLLAQTGLDPRVQGAATNLDDMWDQSTRCYTQGLADGAWAIPLAAGRPTSLAADDSEDDASPPSAMFTGCMSDDHIHHVDAGGWMMADVWYRGLRRTLAP